MKINKLNLQEMAGSGFTHVAKITYEDLTDDSLTQTLAIFPSSGAADAATVINKAAARVVTPFAGVTALIVEVGDSGDVNRFLTSTDMKGNAETGNAILPAEAPNFLAGGLVLGALFTATTEHMDDLTAGEVHIYFSATNLADLSRS